MINREYINTLSNEELAELIVGMHMIMLKHFFLPPCDFIEATIEWLNKEHEEIENDETDI